MSSPSTTAKGVDYNLTDNLRGFFRFSRFRTTLEDVNWTPNQSRIFFGVKKLHGFTSLS